MANHNVVLIAFEEESKAYQALSELRSANAEGRIDIRSAVIVSRTRDGAMKISEGEDRIIGSGTTGGGLLGMLVGVLGGPLGMLLGLGAGALIGGAFDYNRADRTQGALGSMSRRVPAGVTAVVGEVDELAPEVLDGIVGPLGGAVERYPAEQVLAELESAQAAADEAADRADEVIKQERKQERREKWDERVDTLKGKLGIN